MVLCVCGMLCFVRCYIFCVILRCLLVILFLFFVCDIAVKVEAITASIESALRFCSR